MNPTKISEALPLTSIPTLSYCLRIRNSRQKFDFAASLLITCKQFLKVAHMVINDQIYVYVTNLIIPVSSYTLQHYRALFIYVCVCVCVCVCVFKNT